MKSAQYILVSCVVFLLGTMTCPAQMREFRDAKGNVFSAMIGRSPEHGWCFVLANGQTRRINPDELAPADREYMLDWLAKAEHAIKNPGQKLQGAVPTTETSARCAV